MYPGATFTVAGWGAMGEGRAAAATLQAADIPIISNTKCGDRDHFGLLHNVYPTQICAGLENGQSDACSGDSGTPLFRVDQDGTAFVVGVVSWGVGCGRSRKPGVFTRLSSYRSWVRNTLASWGDVLGEASCAGTCASPGVVDGMCLCDAACPTRYRTAHPKTCFLRLLFSNLLTNRKHRAEGTAVRTLPESASISPRPWIRARPNIVVVSSLCLSRAQPGAPTL